MEYNILEAHIYMQIYTKTTAERGHLIHICLNKAVN